ncbi:hypothetical protein ACNF40_01665 [Cuniculiplasma sp. SKW4]|uniref:hypothetical protein n=1 Tax=Cuniculiplasma sp. SKW4 TaxID=3400171 RepID=UPI003FD114EB
MGKIGLKIESSTYEKLKFLKTRFDFVYEYNLSWDEFFQAIVRDSIFILAQDILNSKNGELKLDEIFDLLVGKDQELRKYVKSHKNINNIYGNGKQKEVE